MGIGLYVKYRVAECVCFLLYGVRYVELTMRITKGGVWCYQSFVTCAGRGV